MPTLAAGSSTVSRKPREKKPLSILLEEYISCLHLEQKSKEPFFGICVISFLLECHIGKMANLPFSNSCSVPMTVSAPIHTDTTPHGR